MAKIPYGVLGNTYGKVGPIVMYDWKDIPCMRSLPTPSKKPPSDAQVKCRSRFAYASAFLSPLKILIKRSFSEYATKMTEFNNAVSYTTKNAVSGSFPDFRIHYDRLLLSRGSLPNADEPTAQEDNGLLHFSWKDNSGLGKAAATDRALLICYFPELSAAYHTTEAAMRGDETATLDMSARKGHVVHTWVAFMAADNSTANSVYTGAFVIGGETSIADSLDSPTITAPVTEDLNAAVLINESHPIQQELDFQIVVQSPDRGTEYALQKDHGPNRESVQRQRAIDDDLLFRFRVGIKQGRNGLPDFTGPFVQGPPGERFIYICTGTYTGQKHTTAGHRFKIPLQNIGWELIRKVSGQTDPLLQAAVPGKHDRGLPLPGTLHPVNGWMERTETKT